LWVLSRNFRPDSVVSKRGRIVGEDVDRAISFAYCSTVATSSHGSTVTFPCKRSRKMSSKCVCRAEKSRGDPQCELSSPYLPGTLARCAEMVARRGEVTFLDPPFRQLEFQPIHERHHSPRRCDHISSGFSPYVFPRENAVGHQSTFKTAWRATRRRAKVPYFRIYDLRSTYATRLRAGGVAPSG
jgi:hypothetical protein